MLLYVGVSQYYFNPRSPQGERLFRLLPLAHHQSISIHAPRRGSDVDVVCFITIRKYFNPRSPQGERRTMIDNSKTLKEFQSTLPAGGATRLHHHENNRLLYFNPRSPQGERRLDMYHVSILYRFQSTLPAGGATLL